jgi:hypothetical protein
MFEARTIQGVRNHPTNGLQYSAAMIKSRQEYGKTNKFINSMDNVTISFVWKIQSFKYGRHKARGRNASVEVNEPPSFKYPPSLSSRPLSFSNKVLIAGPFLYFGLLYLYFC